MTLIQLSYPIMLDEYLMQNNIITEQILDEYNKIKQTIL